MRIIHIKIVLAICVAALLIFMTGCSSEPQENTSETSTGEPGFLEDLDLSEIGNKLTDAWDTVGKEVLKDSVADAVDKLTDSDSDQKVKFPEKIPEPMYGKTVKYEKNSRGGTVTVQEIDADGYEAYIYMLGFNGYNAENGVYISENGDIEIKPEYDSEAETLMLSYIQK